MRGRSSANATPPAAAKAQTRARTGVYPDWVARWGAGRVIGLQFQLGLKMEIVRQLVK